MEFKLFFLFFLVLLLGTCPAQARDHDHDQYDDFSYDERSPNGPSHWGEIKQKWRTCSTGKMQSPIDITLDNGRVEVVPMWGRLKRSYKPSKATLVNKGYQIELEWEEGGGCIHIDGNKYTLKGLHWHAPSEHLINGKRFDLEMHLVHESENGNLAVLGMVYEIGLIPNWFLSKMEHYIRKVAYSDSIDKEKFIGYVNPKRVHIGNGRYFRYNGSLTTPPCNESVIWTVMRKVSCVSRKQVQLIREALVHEPKINARPVQPINNRLIKLYTPTLLPPI